MPSQKLPWRCALFVIDAKFIKVIHIHHLTISLEYSFVGVDGCAARVLGQASAFGAWVRMKDC